jgi:hypothetical protein
MVKIFNLGNVILQFLMLMEIVKADFKRAKGLNFLIHILKKDKENQFKNKFQKDFPREFLESQTLLNSRDSHYKTESNKKLKIALPSLMVSLKKQMEHFCLGLNTNLFLNLIQI